MARTELGNRLSTRHRQRQLAIRAAALRELLTLWKTVDVERLSETIESFAEAAALVVNSRFHNSAEEAIDYYIRLRTAEGADGITTINPPQPDPPEAASSLLRGAALAGVINGRRRGFDVERAKNNGFVKTAGSASGLILEGARRTIQNTVEADPAATGRWRRVTGRNSCAFCRRLANRGAVFSEETAGFQAHDHDTCQAEPEFA